MSGDAVREILRFGPFELDAEREELRRAGLVLRLPPQPFRILAMLTSRAGETITREEIQRAIWGDETFVDFEQGINTAIRQIRHFLSDNADAPRYLRTIPRRGYVFIAQVERIAAPNGSAAGPAAQTAALHNFRRSRLLALSAALMFTCLAAAAVVWRVSSNRDEPRHHVIAILPFKVIGRVPADTDPRIFAEELRAKIARLPRSRVTVVDGSAAKRADLLIDGTIQTTSSGVRVLVSGIDAATRTQQWSETCDRPHGRTSGMAIETAHQIAQRITQLYLPPPRREPLLHSRVSRHALELYRRGRLERARSLPDRNDELARQLFEGAAREEPKFAEAYSALADFWAERTLMGPAPTRAASARRSREYARRAIALQPHNAEAQSAMGVLAMQYDYDPATAEAMFRRAIANDPAYVDGHHNLAIALTARGDEEAAIRELEAARELDPEMYTLHPMEPLQYLLARQFEDARARYREILAVRPESLSARWGILFCDVAQKRWAEAIAMTCDIGNLTPPEKRATPATEEEFREIYRRLAPTVEAYSNTRGYLNNDYLRALYYAEADDPDRVFALLHRAVETRVPHASYMLIDPRLDRVRNDPRFEAVVARTQLHRR